MNLHQQIQVLSFMRRETGAKSRPLMHHTLLNLGAISWSTRKSATLQEIQSLIGILNFACKVVPPGRPFLQRIIHLTRKVNKPYHHIKLNAGFRKDIRMWQIFLDQWNGSNFFMYKEWETSEALHLYTDAASTVGFGGIFGTQWFQGKWQPNQTIGTPGISIDWQELYAIVVACSIWGTHWSRKKIIFHCDNQPVVETINNKCSKSPTIMALTRTLTLITLKHNFYFKAFADEVANTFLVLSVKIAQMVSKTATRKLNIAV